MKKLDHILQEALLQNNLLKKTELQSYLKDAQAADQSLKDFLISTQILTEKQILIALSQSFKTKIVNFNDLKIEKAVIDMVRWKFVEYYNILPISFQDNKLTVAVSDPLFVKELDELRVNLKTEIDFVLAEKHRLNEAIEIYYGKHRGIIEDFEAPREGISSGDGQDIIIIDDKNDDATVPNLVNQIIFDAYKKRATDIHVEPYRNKVRFRYRIDGVLVDVNLAEKVRLLLPPIISRIKIMANININEKRLPHDGSAVVKTNDQQLDLRISTMPTPRGESIVIRILPTKVMQFSLERLGFNPSSVAIFRDIIKKPHGIVFITGPTGSGKTTTLYACLNEINSAMRKIITIEDPVEYEMEGVTQVQVNPKVKFTFSTGLRSILRHDPDIIMVGEVRDPETAEIAIKTALTGHLVFSTLHTNDSASGITRLIDMGTEPYLVASSVEAFIAQRLVRVICSKCKVPDAEPLSGIQKEIARSLGLEQSTPIKIYKGAGCDHCNNTGYYGRIAIYEILTMTDNIRAAVLDKPRSDHIKRIAMKDGMTTLRQNGWQAVLNGITTPHEVVNVTVKDEEEKKETAFNQTVSSGQRIEKTAKMDRQRRIYPRSAIPVTISYKPVRKSTDISRLIDKQESEIETVSRNLSAGGINFISQQAIAVGTILEIKIQLDHPPAQAIACLVRVCRLEPIIKDDKFVYNVATYYLDINSDDRRSISHFIEKNFQETEKI
ncbi:MAG: Flp pilus assembly complex ATPase component TadA [Candidatus Omnitrophica bacterium]|nr:Flp pilus assembly complex ATPase component TadA [Candidatus Omnitrophota bacterium]